MKVVQVGALASTMASLSTFTYGYSFSDVAKGDTTAVESTGLTVNEESRIYGGSEANIDKFPFLASLRDTFFEENMCGGTLIAPQYILTAGHCIKTDEMDMLATFGTNQSDGSGLTVPIIEGFRHPMYKKKQHLYDVGLLKLKTPVKRKMAKLCAADGSDNKVGTRATVAGWGKTETSGDMGSPVLQQLTIPVISNAECAKFKKYVGRVTESMLCAGTGDGKDTCNGDSGGPLIVDDDIIIGCVSWGSKCGEQAGIYTRLTYVMDYIEDILAGGDGSKFNVTSSSSGSMEEVSLPSSAEGSSAAATKTPVQESSESGSTEDQTTKATKKPATKASKNQGSESGSDDLSWLFASDSDSASGSSDVPAWLLKYFEGSGSVDLTWLFSSNSDSGSDSAIDSKSASEESGSEDAVLVKGKTTKATKAPVVEDSESGSDDLSWLFDSDSESAIGSESASEESGSEDAVSVKGKTIKATKAKTTKVENSEDSPFQQTSVENESASTSASTSGSESDKSDLVHQSEQSEPTTIKQK
ncbi:hypothetical protein PF005_g14279 [Phytophthora fragariae]|uniref:Peptidase S1 domain-containing protein n=2 Tax=Phytophthora fragariae TaxID=53985 RepID=A0A6A3YVM3_9STRA|nr:hypothetical protein PF003_g13512 [Phytophthora fragariae]KAE8936570.1 hypothetical protein PF009_g13503 [Phytophthora fragariae]KAE8992091.1 hypothetical protein PF011_g17674 [Phytophthora fragariae]KAE9099892.1 hypothetical protein PF010_g15021 [Phytophthora fragariae]KAE9134686.1 hypothetical protein PF006_g14766 [Phytophthora fragariae]